jgi:DNA polymerase-3 subunit epsilon
MPPSLSLGPLTSTASVSPPEPAEGYIFPEETSAEERLIVEDFLQTRNTLQKLLDSGFKGALTRESRYANALEGKRILEHFRHITSTHSGLTLTNFSEVLALMDEIEVWSQPLYAKQSTHHTLIALIDTETTGLAGHDEPISVGTVLLEVVRDSGEVLRELDSYHGYRQPSVPIHPRAQAVHGLTLDQLRGQRWDQKKLHRIIDSAELLVAHNASFDRRMLAGTMPHIVDKQWACSMHALKSDWSKLADGKLALDSICAALMIERPSRHEAMADCRALQRVLMTRSGKTARSKLLMAKLLRNPWAPSS